MPVVGVFPSPSEIAFSYLMENYYSANSTEQSSTVPTEEKNPPPITENLTTCGQCGKVCETVRGLKRHQAYCGRTLLEQPKRNPQYEHFRTSAGEETFRCKKCDVVVDTWSRIRSHMNTTHITAFQCCYCFTKLHSDQRLLSHKRQCAILTQFGAKPFRCKAQNCRHAFGSQEELDNHMLNHEKKNLSKEDLSNVLFKSVLKLI